MARGDFIGVGLGAAVSFRPFRDVPLGVALAARWRELLNPVPGESLGAYDPYGENPKIRSVSLGAKYTFGEASRPD